MAFTTIDNAMSFRRRAALLAAFLAFAFFVAACGSESVLPDPTFTDPLAKIAATSNPDFTDELLGEAVTYEPLLTTSGTQVHMGYWSGPGNHGSLVRVLDAINAYTPQPSEPKQRAIWDEGVTSSLQYPSYVTMNKEHWYERANATGGVVTIYGVTYTDPFPVTFTQADDIWGQYSQRYADMALTIRDTTGLPVNTWCFVEGAHATRIFYKYELPELVILEQAGAVRVFFAKTQNANWLNADDWIQGTANAPAPLPTVSADDTLLDISSTDARDPAYARGVHWDDF